MDVRAFEAMLAEHRSAIVRFVRYRLSDTADWEDVLQEVFLTAFWQCHTLRDASAFKPWLVSIARSKCNDYYRAKARRREVSMDDGAQEAQAPGPEDALERIIVQDTLAALPDKDRQILAMYYLGQHPQREIAGTLGIPPGTVKSRLHTARHAFRQLYPTTDRTKGAPSMETTSFFRFPDKQPAYTIAPLAAPPFPVRLEELAGWFFVPSVGERTAWAIYDHPARILTETYALEATGAAEVHGVPGVAISVTTRSSLQEPEATASRWFVAQLTDTHCRYLSETHMENGVTVMRTFLDSDEFLTDWGLGPDNCGRPVAISPAGRIAKCDEEWTVTGNLPATDIVGAYRLTIGGQAHDTVLLVSIEADGIATAQYIDRSGRTLLFRRYNRDDWRKENGGKLWSQRLPDNEQLTIDGIRYVHWYDCLTDRALV